MVFRTKIKKKHRECLGEEEMVLNTVNYDKRAYDASRFCSNDYYYLNPKETYLC